MLPARKAQRLARRSPSQPTSESFFTTPPHPSQKIYNGKITADEKANQDIANFVDFEKIDRYNIGVDASHTVLQSNSFVLQHGLNSSKGFSIRTCIFGKDACGTFDKNESEVGFKRKRDASTRGSSPVPKMKLPFGDGDVSGKCTHCIHVKTTKTHILNLFLLITEKDAAFAQSLSDGIIMKIDAPLPPESQSTQSAEQNATNDGTMPDQSYEARNDTSSTPANDHQKDSEQSDDFVGASYEAHNDTSSTPANDHQKDSEQSDDFVGASQEQPSNSSCPYTIKTPTTRSARYNRQSDPFFSRP
jgi:hypothetical protein